MAALVRADGPQMRLAAVSVAVPVVGPGIGLALAGATAFVAQWSS